ncbi:translation initiation factor IF-2 [Candidatus Falkowbacteria bacterium CG_4_9_14_3_um_filter_36_9]|uniref:Translation initiation factor IF-2 n=2 Tax=Candidatus Falkowiibacteriota TaxID=1752728 RepID=A0A1J4T8H6_9BACT|nr:MAG: translation initiation factor IF-2 [Candidatus Falkowbacteria bacterium CG1_02_37_44]PIV52175.1 MAG: translation initiation factor IF-2 [Candidatus Falkowbacteria bacterium CG02_land_8_20_14_3_00_36_14]PJA10617.1 MAG: translation initiation factor IF-2 [Candidatus Falkowbacteria bacterium CG_4_10_14_0_2_um_filter_36_22]PJB18450.1 MAG: translation initiation factor IF-2 [Candidatus Falkowbacteria bacterium CG_4_9_14_3_um_filter_36_9]
MNLTELARILKIIPQELRDKLPLLGFDIGQKAIKIDNKTAQRIIKEWPVLIKQLENKLKKEAKEETEEEAKEEEKKKINIPGFISVRDFSNLSGLPVSKILAELMKNGIFTSMNEKIDFDTIWLIGNNLGLEITLDENLKSQELKDKNEENKLINKLKGESEANLESRPPVIVVMGHVDHGKTKLLDTIRQTNVMAGEAGGITQHIGAYQVKRKGKLITFIDTPGHEAFTAMRSRGAKVANIAILVVAADDGVKPQTVEAYNIIKSAKLPFLVAINKIDKEEADINKTKQELSSQLGIVPEDWGGKIICAPVSAKAGKGIEDLLDMVLLTSELESSNMKSNPKAKAMGTVIESHIDKGEGPVATILIQNGTLTMGDQLTFNNQIYGKVRALKNYKNETVKEAAPSMPVKIIGLKIAPEVGDVLEVGSGEKMKNKKNKTSGFFSSLLKSANEKNKMKKINLIIRCDFLGSLEAIEESLEKINTEDIRVNIIYKGMGDITEGDIAKAEGLGASIIGFNINIPTQVKELAREKNIDIKVYNIIYDLINDIKAKMQKLLGVEIVRVNLGRLKVAAVFRTEKNSQIVGGKLIDGKVLKNSFIEVSRQNEIIATGTMTKLQSGKEEINEGGAGQDYGIKFAGKPVIAVGDILQFYKKEEMIKKI